MTGQASPSPRRKWWLRPSIALPALAALIAVAAVFTPQPQDARGGDPRLSTYSASVQGGRLLYELAERLGWDVSRQKVRGVPRDTTAILALLAPTIPLSGAEAHAILEHVRRGGGLLYVLPDESPLSDSLGLKRGEGDRAIVRGDIGHVDEECFEETNGALPMWAGSDMQLWALLMRPARRAQVTFAEMAPQFDDSSEDDGESDSAAASPSPRVAPPVAVGFPLGAGRVVAISDPDLLRNDVLRVCRWGAQVAAVRMLEYLSAGGRPAVVFDEFHQGYGSHPGTFTAIAYFFGRTPEGHALGQLMLAGLILLAAAAPRLVPPRDPQRIERRSPAEHVQALARAYEKVGATRTAVLRLLHGLRRRVARQGPPPIVDEHGADALLDWIARRVPAASEDVALVRHAVGHTIRARELVRVSAAIRRLEAALMQSPLSGPTTGAHRPAAPALTTKP